MMTYLSGVGAKITLALLAMGLLVAASIGVGALVFHQVAQQVNEVTDDRVPEVRNATQLIIAASNLNETLNKVVTATSLLAVRELGSGLQSHVATLSAHADAASGETAARMAKTVS